MRLDRQNVREIGAECEWLAAKIRRVEHCQHLMPRCAANHFPAIDRPCFVQERQFG
jgi:hypothetical protein